MARHGSRRQRRRRRYSNGNVRVSDVSVSILAQGHACHRGHRLGDPFDGDAGAGNWYRRAGVCAGHDHGDPCISALPEYAPPLAYIGGSMGTLIGADLMNLDKITGLGAPVASIGGAGTFDGIFLTGILAVLLAGVATPARPRPVVSP